VHELVIIETDLNVNILPFLNYRHVTKRKEIKTNPTLRGK